MRIMPMANNTTTISAVLANWRTTATARIKASVPATTHWAVVI